MVCLVVYKNPKLRSTINLYIITLAASDLLCAIVAMRFVSDESMEDGFSATPCASLRILLVSVVVYSIPATKGLLAFNRYIRIVKTNHYKKIFSPRKSKVWLSCVWLSLAFYLLMGRVTNWSTFEFIPGYAGCGVAFTTSKNSIIHYGVVLGLFFCFAVFYRSFWLLQDFLEKSVSIKLEVLPSLH